MYVRWYPTPPLPERPREPRIYFAHGSDGKLKFRAEKEQRTWYLESINDAGKEVVGLYSSLWDLKIAVRINF